MSFDDNKSHGHLIKVKGSDGRDVERMGAGRSLIKPGNVKFIVAFYHWTQIELRKYFFVY